MGDWYGTSVATNREWFWGFPSNSNFVAQVASRLDIPVSGWITSIRAFYGGHDGAINTKMAIWADIFNDDNPDMLLGSSGWFTAGVGGNWHTQPIAPIKVERFSHIYAGYVRDTFSPAIEVWYDAGFGQRSYDYNGGGNPQQFTRDATAGGHIPVQIFIEPNLPPLTGAWNYSVTPANNGIISTTNPSLKGSIPHGADSSWDVTTRVQLQIWRGDTGQTLYNSEFTPTSAEISDAAFTRSMASLGVNLPSGVWINANFRHRDTWGVWSSWSAVTRFMVNAGPNKFETSAPFGTIHTLTPNYTGVYSHPNGLHSRTFMVILTDETNTVELGRLSKQVTVPSGGTISVNHTEHGPDVIENTLPALQWNTTYHWISWVWDVGGVGSHVANIVPFTPQRITRDLTIRIDALKGVRPQRRIRHERLKGVRPERRIRHEGLVPFTQSFRKVRHEARGSINADNVIRQENAAATPVSQTMHFCHEGLYSKAVNRKMPVGAEARLTYRDLRISIENQVKIHKKSASANIRAVLYPNDLHIQEELSGLYGDRNEGFRMLKVNAEGQELDDLTKTMVSGSIAVNRKNTVSRTGSFTLRSLDGIDPKKHYLKPIYVLDVNGIPVEYPLGIYQLTVPGKTHHERQTSITVQANDLSILLAETFPYPFVVTKGTNYIDGIRSILSLTKLKSIQIDIPPTNAVAPNDFQWETGTAFITALNDLAQGCGYLPVYISKDGGYLTSRKRLFFYERTPDVIYGPNGTECVVAPFTVEEPQTELKNEVVIQVNDPLREPFWATYYVENPLSPVVLPYRYAMDGLSHDDYWQADKLTPAALIDAAQGENGYPAFDFPGSVSLGGWVYVDENDTGNVAIGGSYTPEHRSFALLSQSWGGGASIRISGDGQDTYEVEDPTPITPGWHHIFGVFNPGGTLNDNLISNSGFEIGMSAPGSSWTQSGDMTATLSFNTASKVEGTRSLEMVGTPNAALQSTSVVQDIRRGFKVGSPVKVNLNRYFVSRSSTQFRAGVQILCGDAEDNLIGTILNQTFTSLDGTWINFQAYSNPVPEGTVYLRVVLYLDGQNATSGTATVRWDAIDVRQGEIGQLKIFVDGQLKNSQFVGLPASIHGSTEPFRLGSVPSIGPPPTRIHDFVICYGGLKDSDVAALFGGTWPANMPFAIAYWRQDDEELNPVVDHTAHGMTLRPVGTPSIAIIEDFPEYAGTRDRFKAIVDVVNFPRMINPDEAIRTAKLIAEENASEFMRATLSTAIDPRRDLHEVYKVFLTDAQGNILTDDNWACDEWSFELRAGGKMLHRIKRVEPF